jgi:Cu/Zn superoxide dismutase
MKKVVGPTLIAVLLSLAIVSPAQAEPAQETNGTFAPVPGFSDYGITGTARMVRTDKGTTVTVHVEGLEPGQTYPAHLHNAPCASGGGGHYQNQIGGAAMPPNELWLASGNNASGITANSSGRSNARGDAPWRARPEAQSIVIHYYADSSIRVACAQLS